MRVALARALYDFEETDIFLFDDVLAALDAHTAKRIGEELLENRNTNMYFSLFHITSQQKALEVWW